jgi:hypothetical protein
MLDEVLKLALYAFLAIPALLMFVIANLWLCLQIRAVWRALIGKKSGSSGYTSYRSSRSKSSGSTSVPSKPVTDTTPPR